MEIRLNGETAATPTSEGGAEVEWRRVRVWFNDYLIADSTVVADLATRLEVLHRQRFSGSRDQRASLATRAVTEPEWWRVMVIRDGKVIVSRIARAPLAEAYARVFTLRFPADLIRAKAISASEAAYPPERPYDPRD